MAQDHTTPTGRVSSSPEMQDLRRRWPQADVAPTDLSAIETRIMEWREANPVIVDVWALDKGQNFSKMYGAFRDRYRKD